MRTTLMLIYGAGATLYLLSFLVTDDLAHRPALLVVDGLAFLGFAIQLAARRHMGPRGVEAFEWIAYGLITTVIAIGQQEGSPFSLFYLWVSLHAAYFLPWRRAAAQVVGIAVLFGLALALTPGTFDAARLLMITGTAAVACALVAGLKLRVNRLVEGLSDAAHTDTLTGLSNRRQLLADAPGIFDRAAEQPAALLLFDLNGFKAYNDTFGHPAGDALLRRLAIRLAEVVTGHGRVYRLGGDEFCALVTTTGDDLAELVSAARGALSEDGDGFSIDTAHGLALIPQEAASLTDALSFADAELYLLKAPRGGSGQQTIDALLCAIEQRDSELHRHAHEVRGLAERVGARLGMDPAGVETLGHGAVLHDLGKIAIPDSILAKPGPLTADERAFVERHCVIGERILAQVPALGSVAAVVRSHHEQFNGSGYPDGLAGEEIPLASRVIAVCDAYEAMRSNRPYRKSLGHDAAIVELARCAGSQFDPEVVAMFLAELSVPDGIPAL